MVNKSIGKSVYLLFQQSDASTKGRKGNKIDICNELARFLVQTLASKPPIHMYDECSKKINKK